MDCPAALRICTIGDLVLDVIVLTDAPLTADRDTAATIRLGAGGQAANVAAWASTLGARARVICVRGSDSASRLAEAGLTRHGVEIRGPRVRGRGGVVVSVRDQAGQRTMASDRGAAVRLQAPDVDPVWVRDCDVLHVSGYCLLTETMAGATIAAATHARRVTVDLASARDIALVGAERFRDRVQALDPELVFATEPERAAIPELHVRWVVKLGAEGAVFPEGHHPATATRVIDTTGAGDALAAGYLVGGPAQAMEAAAQCVAQVGAMPCLRPRRTG